MKQKAETPSDLFLMSSWTRGGLVEFEIMVEIISKLYIYIIPLKIIYFEY